MEKSLKWRKKAIEKEHPQALFAMAMMHNIGQHLPLDMDKAIDYYIRAALSGSEPAQEILATLFKEGDSDSNVEVNAPYALVWYYILAENGHFSAFAAVTELEATVLASAIKQAKDKTISYAKEIVRRKQTLSNLIALEN